MGLFKAIGKGIKGVGKLVGGGIGALTGLSQKKTGEGLHKAIMGLKTPEQYTIDSELYKIPQETRELQAQALRNLSQVARGGFTAEDLQATRQQLGELQAAERGAREANLSQLASRGMLGSGAELAARLSGQQATQQAAAQRGLGLASQAQQRALQAMQYLPTLGSQVLEGDIRLAQAKDAIQQFNKEAARRQFQDELEKYRLGIESAKRAMEGQGALGSFIGNVAGSIATALPSILSDKEKKKNITSGDEKVENVLDKIKAYGYEYKNPEEGEEGYHLGVMAQDIEDSPLSDAVFKTDRGKMVDLNKSKLFELAALANLHRRLKKLEEDRND